MMRFRNLDGSGPHPGSDVIRWAFFDKVTGKRRRSPGSADVPVAKPDLALLRTPPAVGEPARLTWIGHASWLVQVDGVSLLIDPVFSKRISGIVPRNVAAPLQAADLPRIDATLITHSHYDHYDRPSVDAVGARTIAGTGMPASSVLGWWDAERISDTVKVTFVPSQHWSRRGLFDTNETLWGGFVIEGRAACIYHAGDTAWFDGFKEIGERFPGIDAALLPIGAYDPAWFMEKQHMNPEQAVQAYLDLRAKSFVAMHWGTFKLTDEPLDEPPRRVRDEWRRRGLPPDALSIPPVGGMLRAP